MKKSERVREIIRILDKEYEGATIALNFEGTWQLLVAVILSAQCTDERVNKVTPALFARFPTVFDFAEADLDELMEMLKSVNFFRNKARNIKATAIKIVEEFEGEVPDRMEDLLSLAGVARKTANVVLTAGFGKVSGIVVDTHVMRLSGRLGFISKEVWDSKNAVKIEQELMKVIPMENWGIISYILILHGRSVCIARRPRCEACKVNHLCPSSRV